MKFRELKKKKWFACFDWFYTEKDEHYDVSVLYNVGGLYADAESEYDNGLYIVTSRYPFEVTWKDLKYNMTHYTKRHQEKHRKPYQIVEYTGKCKTCGKQIDFREAVHNWNNCAECDVKLYESICEECE